MKRITMYRLTLTDLRKLEKLSLTTKVRLYRIRGSVLTCTAPEYNHDRWQAFDGYWYDADEITGEYLTRIEPLAARVALGITEAQDG